MFGSRENERKKREKRENCKPKTGAVKTAWIQSLGYKRLSSGLYSLTRDVKYQNNQNNMITLREKWELHKTGSFGLQKEGQHFRYA